MKVNIATIGKFHLFDLARELNKLHALGDMYTGYPLFKLKNEGISLEKIHTFPYIHAPYMTRLSQLVAPKIKVEWERINAQAFDLYSAARLSSCDVFVGLSGSTLKAGRKAQRNGAKYVCDRGSSHIRFQNSILIEEHKILGLPFLGIDERAIRQEESEYEEADCITVPSEFNVRTMLELGVAREKIRKIPYGVSLEKSHQTQKPTDGVFNVLFVGAVSVRKGLHYLLPAFRNCSHPNKKLHLVGSINLQYLEVLRQSKYWGGDILVHGSKPQSELKDIMSGSHVLVLPSIEEGLAMVQAQAMACGCPVVSTYNSGAEDLFTNGVEGYIVPIRNAEAIAVPLQKLMDDPGMRDQMGSAALRRVRSIGGWREYGANAHSTYEKLYGKQE